MNTAEHTLPPHPACHEPTLSALFLDNLYDAGRNRGPSWRTQFRAYQPKGRHSNGQRARGVATWVVMATAGFWVFALVAILLAVLT